MKKRFSIRKILITASALILSGTLITGCKKDSGINQNILVSGLMAFNLTPDKPAIGIALSGNLLSNSPLGYTNYTGGYLNVYPGERSVQSYDYTRDSILVSNGFNFEAKKYYSLFVTGYNGNYKNLIVKDDFDSLSSTSGQAYVRYINAIPDSGASLVTITANGSNIFNNAAPFATVSDYKAVNPGDVDVNITITNSDGTALNSEATTANRKISLESGRAYTVLFVGVPGATDTTKAVQIRYVPNGTLTE